MTLSNTSAVSKLKSQSYWTFWSVSLATEVFTDAQAFDVDFPQDATAAQKGIIMGTSLLINAVFYEEK